MLATSIVFCQSNSKLNHCSPQLKFLINELKNKDVDKVAVSDLITEYPVREIDNELRIGALIQISESLDEQLFAKNNVSIGTKAGDIWTVQIPIRSLQEFITIPHIEYIEIDYYSIEEATMDEVRELCFVDEVHQGIDLPQEYLGDGVILGIMDQGFDFRHPTFWDENLENYRVSKVWSQTDNSGTSPNGFNYGSEYIGENEILAAITDNEELNHGTAVASIAGGSGALSGGKYRGMAPKTELIFCGNNHLSNWAEQVSTATSSNHVDALQWMFEYAENVGKSIVVNRSQFNFFGPRDGTDLFDQAISNLVGEGKILVNSAGNDRNKGKHVSYTFNQQQNSAETFAILANSSSNSTQQEALIDIWYDGSPENFRVIASAVDTISGIELDSTVISPTTINGNAIND